ncbi:MAG TPA: hypothetical protein G4O00_07345 [Thermoflexia bacterium]|nr:hypothetical protein [Thermoflexia bacterium]
MSRVRWPLLVIGIVGAIIVAVAVILVVRMGRGTPVPLPVAIDDIPPGTALDPQLFRLTEVRDPDPAFLEAVVTADEFVQYMGLPVLETVHAGSPVFKAQVATEAPNEWQHRVSLLVSDPDHVVFPIPVSPDQVGNYIVAGDYVDVIFTLGRVAAQEMSHEYVVPEEVGVRETGQVTPTGKVGAQGIAPLWVGGAITETLHLPVAKVILPDVRVLRVEREVVQTAGFSYGTGAKEETGVGARGVAPTGDVIRLYLEVDREQAEVLAFALNNGVLNLPAHARPIGTPTEGFTWDDFVDRFFQDRPAPWEEGK